MNEYSGKTFENDRELMQVELNGHPDSYTCAQFVFSENTIKFMGVQEMDVVKLGRFIEAKKLKVSGRIVVTV